MNPRSLLAAGCALAFGLAVCETAWAEPVVYTLYAVTDGKLGSQAFSRAEVVFTFRGDTRNITIQTESGNAVVYRNDQGEATVTLIQGGKRSVAHVARGQIYVRYDTTNGVVGFGSVATGATYPIALSCNPGVFTVLCEGGSAGLDHADQIVTALADAANPNLYSFDSPLPASLTDSTLLTGYVSACAVAYDSSTGRCSSPPPTPIRTDVGDFYLQDEGYYDKGIFTIEVLGKENDEGKDAEDN